MKIKLNILIISLMNTFIIAQFQNNSRANVDPLSETPLYSIPAEMSFEEYQDMNRRFNLAVAWSTIPIPGITHHYAGEKKMAKRLFYLGLGGLTSIILGASMNGEPAWPDTSTDELRDIYSIYNIGTDDESWYKNIPVSMENGQTNYKLEKINKESDNEGGLFIFAGVLILVGDFIYDRLWGIKKIEEKRDKVRYKYGQQLKLTLSPMIDLNRKEYGLALRKGFDLKRKK